MSCWVDKRGGDEQYQVGCLKEGGREGGRLQRDVLASSSRASASERYR